MGLSVMSKVYRASCERQSAACAEISRQPCPVKGIMYICFVEQDFCQKRVFKYTNVKLNSAKYISPW